MPAFDFLSTERLEDDVLGVVYHPGYLDNDLAEIYLDFCLTQLPWNEEMVTLFGKTHRAPRLSCAIADLGCVYRYQGSQIEPMEFPPCLNQLRHQLSSDLQVTFNYVLATLYRTGHDHVGWHADDERDLVNDEPIVNISLGGTRRFHIKTRDGRSRRAIDTQHGSLTILSGGRQHNTKHRLAKTQRAVSSRVVLSFRQVLN